MKDYQYAALKRFADRNGRYWKDALRNHWQQACARLGDEAGPLQELRNSATFGVRGLARFKFTVN